MVDWESIREQCVRSGGLIRLNKEEVLPLPAFFSETSLGLSKRALKQYRDDRSSNSLHLHEFTDYFLVHVDTFNPEFHPIAHGVVDTPGITLAIVAGAIATYFLMKTVEDMSFLPSERSEFKY